MISHEFLTRYMRKRTLQGTPAFFSAVKKAYLLKSLFLLPFVFLPDIKKTKRVAFVIGPHALKQISPNDRHNLCIIGGPVEYFLARKYGAAFINASLFYIALSLTLFTFLRINKVTEFFLKGLLKRANAMSSDTGVLIHHSDALPYGRLLNDFFQKNKFTTICFQHGYFDGSIFETDGFYSDFNIAIDIKQKEILKEAIGNNSQFSVISDLSISHKIYCARRREKRCILLGEGWKSHNIKIHNNYIKFIRKIRGELIQTNRLIRYRPHPSEKLDLMLLLKMFPVTLNGRGEGINCQDIYIGASSSLLAEAAQLGATVISIKGLVPTHSIKNSSIMYVSQEDCIIRYKEIIDVPHKPCLGHDHEFVSIEKLVLLLQNNKL